MKLNWLKIENKLSKFLIVLKAILVIAIEVGIIALIIYSKLHETHPIMALIITNLTTMGITYWGANILEQFGQAISDSTMKEKLRVQADKIQKLTNENGELKQLLDTNSQTISHFNRIDFGVKIELMENTKIGYLVKEEKLEDVHTEELKELIPHPSFLERLGQKLGLEEEHLSVLYIDKIYHKSTIGIDLKNIRYAINERKREICLCGVELQVLHNASQDLIHDKNDIKHCWIINKKADGNLSIKNDDDYKLLKEAYKEHYERQAHETHIEQANILCEQFTQALQTCLQQRYENLKFISCDSDEYNKYEWHTLNNGETDVRVMNILIDMHWGIKMIEQSYSS